MMPGGSKKPLDIGRCFNDAIDVYRDNFLTFLFASFFRRILRARVRVSTTSSGATAKAGRIAARSSSASSMSSVTRSGPADFFLFAIALLRRRRRLAASIAENRSRR